MTNTIGLLPYEASVAQYVLFDHKTSTNTIDANEGFSTFGSAPNQYML